MVGLLGLLGVLSHAQQFGPVPYHLVIAIEDLDLDGDLDLVSQRGWYENDGDAHFSAHHDLEDTILDVGDADGDGKPDLLTKAGWMQNLGGQFLSIKLDDTI